ncbi:hypothetical protein KIPB_004998 [Kipferlia bialata]|uniref:Uncharacterized protein n=1 Tax=Kipferlia bialata TaxID=797122 RepID=A0A9K3CVZ1_9EUKA|nr:hypothetical protein KIPB_004998 [Kipferlia bialata]|eukprot:g4998.t1
MVTSVRVHASLSVDDRDAPKPVKNQKQRKGKNKRERQKERERQKKGKGKKTPLVAEDEYYVRSSFLSDVEDAAYATAFVDSLMNQGIGTLRKGEKVARIQVPLPKGKGVCGSHIGGVPGEGEGEAEKKDKRPKRLRVGHQLAGKCPSEGQYFELKAHRSYSRRDKESFLRDILQELSRYTCGYLNTHGGHLVMGVSDRREQVVEGTPLTYEDLSTLRKALSDFLSACRPSPPPGAVRLRGTKLIPRKKGDPTRLLVVLSVVSRVRGAMMRSPDDVVYIRSGASLNKRPPHVPLPGAPQIGGFADVSGPYLKSCVSAALERVKAYSMMEQRQQLVDSVRAHSTTLVHAATGAGKSSIAPLILLDAQIQDGQPPPFIVVAQHRRLPSVQLAMHVSALLQRPLGSIVGYYVGGRPVYTSASRILYTTCGVFKSTLERLLNLPQRDPMVDAEAAAHRSAKPLDQMPTGDDLLALQMEGGRFPDIIVFDEVHERTLEVDLCLHLAKRLIEKTRLVVMSATLFARPLIDYFTSVRPGPAGSTMDAFAQLALEAPSGEVATVQVRTRGYPITHLLLDHPIVRRYLQKGLERGWPAVDDELMAPKSIPNGPAKAEKPVRVHMTVMASVLCLVEDFASGALTLGQCGVQRVEGGLSAMRTQVRETGTSAEQSSVCATPAVVDDTPWKPRAILVFVSGIGQVMDFARFISALPSAKNVAVRALHSSLSDAAMRAAIDPLPEGTDKIKVILATSIAESSITVPDVDVVLDLCVTKEAWYSTTRQGEELIVTFVGSDVVKQRAGRTGLAISYVSRLDWLPARARPEVRRRGLGPLLLSCLSVPQSNPITLLQNMPEPPEPTRIGDALAQLRSADCVTSGYPPRLTPLGTVTSRVPLSLRAVRLALYSACVGVGEAGCILAAVCDRKTPIKAPITNMGPTVRAHAHFALGSRSDTIAAYNAYVFWLRNRRAFRAHCVPASEDANAAEARWLGSLPHNLSLYSLQELDDTVLMVRNAVAALGLVSPPRKSETDRKVHTAVGTSTDEYEERQKKGPETRSRDVPDFTDADLSNVLSAIKRHGEREKAERERAYEVDGGHTGDAHEDPRKCPPRSSLDIPSFNPLLSDTDLDYISSSNSLIHLTCMAAAYADLLCTAGTAPVTHQPEVAFTELVAVAMDVRQETREQVLPYIMMMEGVSLRGVALR